MSKYAIGMIIFALLPFIFAILSLLFFILGRYIFSKQLKKIYLHMFITTNLVFIFLMYPSITSYTFGMFNCMEIEGIQYLVRDFSV
jgi:hypothetical protein